MQIGQIQSLLGGVTTPQSLLGGVTTPAPAASQPPTGFQSLADSLIALLSDDDPSTESTGVTSLLSGDDTATQSQDELQSPPDSPRALLLQAQLGL
jgi:hypothetical protein